ncbi:hypothetical protein PC121_g18293 [Phytophthora cactorum]|nr:hypothetical protein PC120_g17960 [Phytophthora cactorum]KAG3050605.1 hypothetical protein PC121_g18293 [Phytophthora cactorum]
MFTLKTLPTLWCGVHHVSITSTRRMVSPDASAAAAQLQSNVHPIGITPSSSSFSAESDEPSAAFGGTLEAVQHAVVPATHFVVSASPSEALVAATEPVKKGKGVGRRLTDRQRVEILELIEKSGGSLSNAEIGRRYGITRAAIQKLKQKGAEEKAPAPPVPDDADTSLDTDQAELQQMTLNALGQQTYEQIQQYHQQQVAALAAATLQQQQEQVQQAQDRQRTQLLGEGLQSKSDRMLALLEQQNTMLERQNSMIEEQAQTIKKLYAVVTKGSSTL